MNGVCEYHEKLTTNTATTATNVQWLRDIAEAKIKARRWWIRTTLKTLGIGVAITGLVLAFLKVWNGYHTNFMAGL